jgi:SAM-dependent methyltransferase
VGEGLGAAARPPVRRRDLGRELINDAAATGFQRGAADYEKARPSYPPAVLDALPASGAIVDLAAGTGKLTRLLPGRVVAVEPVHAMRTVAATFAPTLAGTAELLPLRDACVDAVTVAQAFHWFDASRALAEIARVLRPGGTLLLVWNDRDERVPWVRAFSTIVHAHDTGAYESDVDYAPVVAASGCFTPLERRDADNRQRDVTIDVVVERALSTSYIASASADVQAEVERDVRALLAGVDEPFDFPYVTRIHTCTRC